jgi:hypothetical protein
MMKYIDCHGSRGCAILFIKCRLREEIMTKQLLMDDYITPIKEIINDKYLHKRKRIREIIYGSRKINYLHFQKRYSVNQTVNKLLEPQWRTKIRRFDPEEWRNIAKFIWERTAKFLGRVSIPEIVLYPGFNTMNGRVYKVGKKPVIGCSPDFPHCTGKNLTVLLAHEYAHFIRWHKTGISSANIPIYALIYEEGWAIWITTKILSEFNPGRIFMSNLHKGIGMPDPKDGYLVWCRKNLKTIAIEAKRVLKSKNKKDLGRFFQCKRFESEKTPIRTGYYLGFRLFEMLSERMTPGQLFKMKPTPTKISDWLDELICALE